MIKFNIKTVSARDYQGIETRRCSITNQNYSDLSTRIRRDPNLPLIDLWKGYKAITKEESEQRHLEAKEREIELGIKPVYYKPIRTKAVFK